MLRMFWPLKVDTVTAFPHLPPIPHCHCQSGGGKAVSESSFFQYCGHTKNKYEVLYQTNKKLNQVNCVKLRYSGNQYTSGKLVLVENWKKIVVEIFQRKIWEEMPYI